VRRVSSASKQQRLILVLDNTEGCSDALANEGQERCFRAGAPWLYAGADQ